MSRGMVSRSALTLTLELCGMAGCPFCAGRVISKTPKESFFMGWESRFQSSASRSAVIRTEVPGKLTEFAKEIGGLRVGSPFSVEDVVLAVYIETKLLDALGGELATRWSHPRGVSTHHTLENLLMPPSVSLMVLIQSCALLYRLRKASLNGASQGSSFTTPV